MPRLNGGQIMGGRELVTDFRDPATGLPYNPDFAAMARSAGIEGVRVEKAADLGQAVREAVALDRPYLIDANIGADMNPAGAGAWDLPRLGHKEPALGGRHIVQEAEVTPTHPGTR